MVLKFMFKFFMAPKRYYRFYRIVILFFNYNVLIWKKKKEIKDCLLIFNIENKFTFIYNFELMFLLHFIIFVDSFLKSHWTLRYYLFLTRFSNYNGFLFKNNIIIKNNFIQTIKRCIDKKMKFRLENFISS